MKPEPIDLQNIGKVYHNENEAVCNEENYEDETKEENLCCRQVKRGEVYFADYYYDNGILADKRRPAVIVSNHGINEKAPFVKVVYLTTAPKSNHPAHIKVQCGKPGTALCEKSQTISKSFLENYIGTLTEEEMFQIDRGIQIGYGIKNNVYDYDNEEDSFVKDIANYIQEMDHLLSKLCDLKELDQKARHIDIEQLLGKDVIALGRILPDSGLEAVRAAMVSQADKEQKKIREKLELMIGKRYEFGIVDCDFEEMADKKIVEIYDKILEGNRVEKKFYRLNLLDEANMYFFVNATSKKEAFEIIKRHRNFSKVMNLDICEDDIEEVALEKLYEEE